MNDMVVREETAIAVATPMALLQIAVQQGADLDKLERLMGLQERWEANEARKAFHEALSAAKSEIPVIFKNREVDFSSAKGRTHYKYEDLGEIARTVDPILAKHGLSYRYRTSSTPNEPIIVTCIITHRQGHSEENMLCAGRDESGNKNSIQAIGSTLTYLQRMTLKAALGLAASTDDDGRSSGKAQGLPQDTFDAYCKRIKEATTKEKAKEIWSEGVKECEKHGDLDSAKALKTALLEQSAFIDQASKA